MDNIAGKPYKVCDATRKTRKGIVASSFLDLTSKLSDKLSLGSLDEGVTVVLEADGTEVDEEDYFATLEPNTSLMVLCGKERWSSEIPQCHISVDQTDAAHGEGKLTGLVGRLKQNLCHVSVLGGPDLELLSDMDPDSVADIVFPPDKEFLEQLKEASGRILCEKRQAHDAMELLHLYHKSVSGNNEASATAQPELV